LTGSRNSSRGSRGDGSDEDDVAFRMASVSGFRAAVKLDVTPFRAANGQIAGQTAGRGAGGGAGGGGASAAARLQRMYGVTCGANGDRGGLGDGDRAGEQATSAAEAAGGRGGSGGGGGKSGSAAPMDGASLLEQRRLETNALRALVLERLYAVDVAPRQEEPDAEGAATEEDEGAAAALAAAAAVAEGASGAAAATAGEGAVDACADGQETLIVTRLELRANGLRQRLPDCFHGLRSLVKSGTRISFSLSLSLLERFQGTRKKVPRSQEEALREREREREQKQESKA
jgi:hypothetical protein